MVVDNIAEEAGKYPGEGDSALEVCDVPTGGGRCAATTACSDSGANRTTCDEARGMSIRLKNPTWVEYEAILGESNRECLDFMGKRRPIHPVEGPSGIRTDQIVGGKTIAATGMLPSSSLI
jgi:hypothetical protein